MLLETVSALFDGISWQALCSVAFVSLAVLLILLFNAAFAMLAQASILAAARLCSGIVTSSNSVAKNEKRLNISVR